MDLSNLSKEQIAMLSPEMIGEIISTLPLQGSGNESTGTGLDV